MHQPDSAGGLVGLISTSLSASERITVRILQACVVQGLELHIEV